MAKYFFYLVSKNRRIFTVHFRGSEGQTQNRGCQTRDGADLR